jgi:histidinol-phosphate aminotransferase
MGAIPKKVFMEREAPQIRVRPAVETMKPYVPGRSLESVQREFGLTELVKMNQNENPLGPSPMAMAAATAALGQVHTYPEGSAPALRETLAEQWELPDDWFLVGNGSDEVFRLLAETYLEPGNRIVVGQPSFAGYPLVAELMGAHVLRVPLVDGAMDVPGMVRLAAQSAARMVFLCRPNNPTGAVFAEDVLRRCLPDLSQETLVVLDEAYREFDETPFDSRRLLLDHPNVIVTRTFSKIFGMAGFRLGYGVMAPTLLNPLLRVRDPFSVNNLAVAAGVAALGDKEHLERSITLVREGKRFLSAVFDRLGLSYVPTQANFVLFHTPRPAVEMYEAMLRRGILLRPCVSFGLPHSLRVTIGTTEENEMFAEALEFVLRDGTS